MLMRHLANSVQHLTELLLIESAIFLPLVSVDPEYQDGWCALKSPRIRLSFVVRRCSIED